MGYKTNFLCRTIGSMVLKELLEPAAKQLPEAIGRFRSNNKWQIHFYCLSASNPADSFCCVSTEAIAANPLQLLEEGSLSSSLPLLLVPVRFSKDHLTGMTIRPSSTSNATALANHWIGSSVNLAGMKIANDSGVNLLAFNRAADGMEFVAAGSTSAAQTSIADLSMKRPLWAELNSRGPAVPGLLAQALG
jgi:hypothetical protein